MPRRPLGATVRGRDVYIILTAILRGLLRDEDIEVGEGRALLQLELEFKSKSSLNLINKISATNCAPTPNQYSTLYALTNLNIASILGY